MFIQLGLDNPLESHPTVTIQPPFPLAFRDSLFTPQRDLGTPLRRQARHKTGEFHQVHNSEQRPPLSHKDFRIRRSNVGPMRRNGANGSVVQTQQESLTRPVIAFADSDEPPASERMEGMSYADKMRSSRGNVRILR